MECQITCVLDVCMSDVFVNRMSDVSQTQICMSHTSNGICGMYQMLLNANRFCVVCGVVCVCGRCVGMCMYTCVCQCILYMIM